MKRLILITTLLVLAASVSVWSTAPDTIRIGYQNAYHVGGGVFRVPLHLFNDNTTVRGLSMPFRYVCTGGLITPDSVTRAGRSWNTNLWDLVHDMYGGGETNPDSTCLGMCCLTGQLEPGSGIIADLWFSGGYPGDLLTFIPLVDYVMPPNCPLQFDMPDPDGGPVAPVTNLTIVESQIDILCQSHYTVEALQWLIFGIDAYGGLAPYELEIVSVAGPSETYPAPYISGSGPWEFHWRPGSNNAGTWTITIGITDAEADYATKAITVEVTPAPPDPCEIVRGDITCDAKIDIADLVAMAGWMFNGGMPPVCPGTKLGDDPKGFPDTVRIRGDMAYFLGDDIAVVPVWIANDNEIGGLSVPLAYATTGAGLECDSMTRAGRTYGNAAFDLYMGLSGSPGPAPDSTCLGFVCMVKPLQPGVGVVSNLWFSGVTPGDIVTINGIEFYPPSCDLQEQPPDPDGGPVFAGDQFEVGQGQMYISCGNYFTVRAFSTLTVPIQVEGGTAPYNLEIVSFNGNPDNMPTLTGDGPWTLQYTPRGNEVGTRTLVLRATDADDETVDITVIINVTEFPVTECNYLRGDVDCNGAVDIADLVFVVNYMFNGGPEPDCGQK
ncbi:MAG: hypothetical protein ABIE70_09785 [bacterium]